MKKIVIIDGCPRKNFNTVSMLQKFAEGAASVSDQIEVKTIRLYALDTEGMQTMRTMASNMAWLLKKIHADGQPGYPEREEWQPMHFIR